MANIPGVAPFFYNAVTVASGSGGSGVAFPIGVTGTTGYEADYSWHIKQYLQPLADCEVEKPAKGFVQLLKKYPPKAVRKVVEADFPQWLEELDKLLILK